MPGPRRRRPAPPVRALDPVLAVRLGELLADAPATGEHRTETGETYTALNTELVVEVLAGTGRHGTLNVVRIR
ncbi:hypothetical protein DBP12_36245 [Streptomyces sp. CS014]|nr:hypothetical protein DBP12_36245 [Streptomyces sp. CS014]